VTASSNDTPCFFTPFFFLLLLAFSGSHSNINYVYTIYTGWTRFSNLRLKRYGRRELVIFLEANHVQIDINKTTVKVLVPLRRSNRSSRLTASRSLS
jgi:hypothetical protein